MFLCSPKFCFNFFLNRVNFTQYHLPQLLHLFLFPILLYCFANTINFSTKQFVILIFILIIFIFSSLIKKSVIMSSLIHGFFCLNLFRLIIYSAVVFILSPVYFNLLLWCFLHFICYSYWNSHHRVFILDKLFVYLHHISFCVCFNGHFIIRRDVSVIYGLVFLTFLNYNLKPIGVLQYFLVSSMNFSWRLLPSTNCAFHIILSNNTFVYSTSQ